MDNEGAVDIIKSPLGGDRALHNGFSYNLARESSVCKHWRCSIRGCKGRIDTKGVLAIQSTPHNHESDVEKIKEMK